MSGSASTEITTQLVRRHRAGRSSIVIVNHPGNTVPGNLERRVSRILGEKGLKTEQVDFNELAPSPVARLVELRRDLGTDVFSITCDADRLEDDSGQLVNALNLHRNTFTKHRLSAIFWIPKRGMRSFSDHASNFLDFRTAYVEVDADAEALGAIAEPVLGVDVAPRPVRQIAFISYAHRYGEWVRALHVHLERCLSRDGEPARVFLDQVDLGAGRSWVGQLQAGIGRAENLVLVVTPEALASPRVADEWQSFVGLHRGWVGRLQVVLLVDTPLPPFLVGIQYVDFREHDRAKYLTALQELCAGLLGQEDRRDLPDLPEDLEVPPTPATGLPRTQRSRLVDWMTPILARKAYRRAVATGLGLERFALDGYPAADCAASAALVLATGDDDPLQAALRIIDVLTDELEEDERARVKELAPLRAEIENAASAGPGPDRGLLGTWLERVVRDHGTLVSYFQERAGFDLLDLVYVQLELRPELRELEPHRRGLNEPLSLRDVLDLNPLIDGWVTRRWVVRGDPGAGKTTLLRHLAAKLAEEPEPAWVPVFESLPRLMQRREWLLDRLERQMVRAGPGARGLAAVLDRNGQEGRLLLLLDGLDEVAREDRDDAEALLRDLSARWPKTPIVVATRPIGYRRPANEFQELDLLPFDAARRREFLARWFGRFTGTLEHDRSAEAAAILEENPGLRELAANPLYLTLMALLVEQDNPPDRHRAGLYDQVFHLLLNGKHRPTGEPMECQAAVRAVLRYLAHAMTQDNRDAEPLNALEARLYQPEADPWREPLERVPRWRRSMRPFLDDLARRTGILGPHDGADADWRFLHRTFREALTAEYLETVYRRDGADVLLEHARQINGDESRWAEPYALLAGRVDDADDLVRTLVKENRALGLRALATAQGLEDDTLREVLALSDDWKERAKVYQRLPELVGEAERALALLDRLRRRVRNGNDLYFLDVAVGEVGRLWSDYASRAEQLRGRLYDHVPPAPKELFQWVETPRDGRVPLWCEIPAGCFWMGSSEGEGHAGERPRHEVTLASLFHLGAVPVTNAQYAAFDPAHQRTSWEEVPDDELPHHPVESITWYEAVSFCRWLSVSASWARGARLPTEEEWEYACRAGTETRYWNGDSEAHLGQVGWYESNSGYRPHCVGKKPANPWGLYDMHGNVWELSSSRFTADYTGLTPDVEIAPATFEPADPADGTRGSRRLARGGSFSLSADWARAAFRFPTHAGFRNEFLGFRVLLPQPESLLTNY